MFKTAIKLPFFETLNVLMYLMDIPSAYLPLRSRLKSLSSYPMRIVPLSTTANPQGCFLLRHQQVRVLNVE